MQKQNYKCRIDFENKWMAPGALLAGMAFFLLMTYYFAIVNFTLCSFMEIVFSMFVPIFLLIAYIVLLKGIRNPSVSLYGGIIIAYLLTLIIQVILQGGIFNIIFSVFLYIACIIVCFGVLQGHALQPKVMVVVFIFTAGWRAFFSVIPQLLKLQILSCILDLSAICALLGFGLFALCLEIVKTRRKRLREE